MASVRERNGRFTGLYRDEHGKQKSAGSYGTFDEAMSRATVAELDARPPETAEVYATSRRGQVTVAGYAPGWLDGQELLESNSVEIARSALKRITPHLGAMTRDEVTPTATSSATSASDTASVGSIAVGVVACEGTSSPASRSR